MKQEIVKSALNDFMQYGFKTFTMDDLARKLGMSKKTLYEYFPSKNDFVEACLDYALDITIAKTDTFLQGEHSLIENVFRNQKKMQDIFNLNSVRPIWELKKYYPKTYERMDAEFTKCDYLFVDKILEQGWKENLFRKDIDLQFFKIFCSFSGIDRSIYIEYSAEYSIHITIYHGLGFIIAYRGYSACCIFSYSLEFE